MKVKSEKNLYQLLFLYQLFCVCGCRKSSWRLLLTPERCLSGVSQYSVSSISMGTQRKKQRYSWYTLGVAWPLKLTHQSIHSCAYRMVRILAFYVNKVAKFESSRGAQTHHARQSVRRVSDMLASMALTRRTL